MGAVDIVALASIFSSLIVGFLSLSYAYRTVKMNNRHAINLKRFEIFAHDKKEVYKEYIACLNMFPYLYKNNMEFMDWYTNYLNKYAATLLYLNKDSKQEILCMNEMIVSFIKNIITDNKEYIEWLEIYGIECLQVIEVLTNELNEL